jgi:hypothetical protein
MKKVIFICRLLAAVWLGNDCGPIAVTKPPAFAESVIGIGALLRVWRTTLSKMPILGHGYFVYHQTIDVENSVGDR